MIIGASENPNRYAAQAVKLLKEYEHALIAIGRKNGTIHKVPILGRVQFFEDIDTVSLYINEKIQRMYYFYVISLNPKRVIFNPGSENPEFIALLKEYDIEVSIACTLVLLRTGQY